MTSGAVEPSCHAVVFDVNVYLDVAQLLGTPFTWEKFNTAAARFRQTPLTPLRGSDRQVDSLRALAVTLSGQFAGRVPLEVWTSVHIDKLVVLKASQPQDGERPEDSGLGWSLDNAAALLDDLVWGIVFDKSGGGICKNTEIPYGSPPLSHEDGIVYRTAEQCGDEQTVRYCITNDRMFRTASLPGTINVLYPHEWIALVRKSRLNASLPPRPGPGPREQGSR